MDALPQMQPVLSTQIAAVGYAMDSSELVIQFVGGAIYRYENVPAQVHAEFMAHKSAGAYFYKHIKYAKDENGNLRYRYTKLRGPDMDQALAVQNPAKADPINDVPF